MWENFFKEERKFMNPYINKIKEHEDYIIYDNNRIKAHKGKWHEHFGNNNPIYFEIGSGAGNFLVKKAEVEKGKNFIGLEIRFKRVVFCAKKARKRDLTNIVFMRKFSEEIGEIFAENEIDGLYVNFPEPWEREKKIKNRVIKEELFQDLNKVMKKGGKLYLKTDHTMYYEYVLELVSKIDGYSVVYHTDDLYSTEYVNENIPTEFEQLFTAKGTKIKYIEIEKEV